MSSKKQGAAKKPAPKKAPRKKPGPSARAKAREAKVGINFSLPEPRGTVDIVASMKARTDALAAQARLDNARAEELEIKNRAEREMHGFDNRYEPMKPAFTFAGECASDEPRTATEARVQDARRNTVHEALEKNHDCLAYTEALVERLEGFLQPLLRSAQTSPVTAVATPEPDESEIAGRVRASTRRSSALNARLLELMSRLDLPN